MNMNKAIIAAAQAQVGIEEWVGSKQNLGVLAMFAASGNGWVTA